MSLAILVPVKDYGTAKSRMSSILSPDERAALARTMFEDVARALGNLGAPVIVVTNSKEAARRGSLLGWRIVPEDRQVSESASVDAASLRLRQEGIDAVLRLPADLPLITSADVEQVLSELPPRPSAVLAPSSDGMGTNALLRSPPDLFPSRFGHNSFVLHLQEARRSQARVNIVDNANIALDIDDLRDLGRFLERPTDTLTYELLVKMRVAERLDKRGFA